MTLRLARALPLALALSAAAAAPLVAAPPAPAEDSPATTLGGRILDPSGNPVAGALVTLTPRDGGPPTATHTDVSGKFHLAPAAGAGPHAVRVVAAGFRPVERSWDPSRGSRLDLTLEIEGLAQTVTVTSERPVTTLGFGDTFHETPRSLTVVGPDRIREQGFKTVNDAVAYTPGMAVNAQRNGGYHFYSRGYRMVPEDTRIDGFAGVNAGGRYSATLFGIEQAELLRGPAGIKYGAAGSPGGLINLVTKRPEQTRMTRIDVRTGGYAGNGVSPGDGGSRAIDLDTTGPIGSSGRVLYRALLTTESMRYFTDGVRDENRYAQGSLTFALDDQGSTTFTPLVRYTRMRRPVGGGMVVSPSTSLSTRDGASGPIETGDLSPIDLNLSAGGGVDETIQAGFDLRTRLSPALSINGAYRYIGYDTAIEQFVPQVTTPDQIDLLREQGQVQRLEAQSQTERRYHGIDVNGTYEIVPAAGTWRTSLLLGGQTRIADTRATTPDGTVPGPQSPIDIYTGEAPPLTSTYPPLRFGDWAATTFWNTYLQSRTTLARDRLVVTLGLGTGETRPEGATVRKGGLLPNASVVYNLRPAVAIYGSLADSFNPVDAEAEDEAGNRGGFDPARGRNLEAGVKLDPRPGLSLNLALFDTRVDNALVQSGPADLNRNGNRYFAAAGKRRSRGVELGAEVEPLPELRLTGAVSYLDAVYLGGGPESAAATTAIPGSRAEKAPEWSFSLWSRYDVPRGGLAGLGAGLGVIRNGERLGGNGARTPTAPDPLLLPAFTRVDAAIFYRLNQRIDLALNVENLLDELIFVSGTVGSSLEVAAPRTVSLRLGYRF